MDISVHPQDDNIRKIEDIIDIQKAKGNYSVRQVAFNLPSESNSTGSTNLAKSLESGLSIEKNKPEGIHKKLKKLRAKRSKSPLPDVISWPSDSDITVLKLKLCMTNSDLKEKVGNVFLGDGLHQPDSSSMVNLATLILQSQSPSKHSMNVEEYLLPLTSWEHQQNRGPRKDLLVEEEKCEAQAYTAQLTNRPNAMCSHEEDNYYSSQDSDFSKTTTKSKMARFLRLYFCPCCTCLYRLEKMQEEPSACFTKRRASVNIY